MRIHFGGMNPTILPPQEAAAPASAPKPQLPSEQAAVAAKSAFFGLPLQPLGQGRWFTPKLPQGELPPVSPHANINEGIFTATFIKDDGGSLGLNVTEVPQVRHPLASHSL